MTVCNYDGDYRFVDGSPTIVGKGVTSLTDPYELGVSIGLDGATYLDGFPSSSDTSGAAISFWVNFNQDLADGFTPNLEGMPFFVTSDGVTNSVAFKIYNSEAPAGAQNGPWVGSDNQNGSLTAPDVQEPFNFIGKGWVHILASIESYPNAVSPDVNMRTMLYIDDTLIWQTNDPAVIDVSAGVQWIGGTSSSDRMGIGEPTVSNAFPYCAMSEFWVIDQFIDWSKKSNRYKFHKYENGLYKAIDIGARGLKPGFGRPIAYHTGNPTGFLKNRGSLGGTLVVNGDALVTIESSPF